MAAKTIPFRSVEVTKSDSNYITDQVRYPVNAIAIQATSVNLSTDTITQTAHGYLNGYRLTPTALGTVTGITIGTIYYIINVTTDTFQISVTYGGSAVDLTGASTTPPTLQITSILPAAQRVYGSIYVGTGGDVVVLPQEHLDTDDSTLAPSGAVKFTSVPSGAIIVGHFKKVFSTGTTASEFVCQYDI